MKLYREGGRIATCILNLDTTWRWAVSFNLSWEGVRYPLDRRLREPQSHSGRSAEENAKRTSHLKLEWYLLELQRDTRLGRKMCRQRGKALLPACFVIVVVVMTSSSPFLDSHSYTRIISILLIYLIFDYHSAKLSVESEIHNTHLCMALAWAGRFTTLHNFAYSFVLLAGDLQLDLEEKTFRILPYAVSLGGNPFWQ
jgi:hypothetical protein